MVLCSAVLLLALTAALASVDDEVERLVYDREVEKRIYELHVVDDCDGVPVASTAPYYTDIPDGSSDPRECTSTAMLGTDTVGIAFELEGTFEPQSFLTLNITLFDATGGRTFCNGSSSPTLRNAEMVLNSEDVLATAGIQGSNRRFLMSFVPYNREEDYFEAGINYFPIPDDSGNPLFEPFEGTGELYPDAITLLFKKKGLLLERRLCDDDDEYEYDDRFPSSKDRDDDDYDDEHYASKGRASSSPTP